MVDIIDEALDILHHTGPEYSGGSNHGPMAAEALLAMGRPEAVLPWVERYKRRLTDHPTPAMPITRAQWHEALGDVKRLADWIAFSTTNSLTPHGLMWCSAGSRSLHLASWRRLHMG
jgi:hypothetical protein